MVPLWSETLLLIKFPTSQVVRCRVPFCNTVKAKMRQQNLLHGRLDMARGLLRAQPDPAESDAIDVSYPTQPEGLRRNWPEISCPIQTKETRVRRGGGTRLWSWIVSLMALWKVLDNYLLNNLTSVDNKTFGQFYSCDHEWIFKTRTIFR